MLVLVSMSSGIAIEPSPRPINDSTTLKIYYTYGSCHAEWGRTNIWIDESGNGLYESGSGSLILFEGEERFEHQRFRKAFALNETELLGLANEIEKSDFYSLNDSYYDPEIMDGYCASISITRDNVTKSVSVANAATPEAYRKAAFSIEGLAENKTHPAINEEKNLPSLIEALGDNDNDVRASAAWLLGRRGDPKAVDALIEVLKDDDSYVRWKAAEALADLNDSRAVDPLIQGLDDENEWVRLSAAEALGNLRDPKAVVPLMEALSDNDSLVRENVIRALGNLEDERAVGPLAKVFNEQNESWYVQNAAAEALKKLGEPVI
jgi:hypothetical protein